MSLMSEYIARRMTGFDLENELLSLIAQYNQKTGSYLLVYAGALSKPVEGVSMSMEDYYIIADLLKNSPSGKIDVYIETPGGRGEAAEEIVNHLHTKYKEVNYIVAGEAKSAGTLVVLSGNAIAMTKTGSLGPIDAQVAIGRGRVSAHDYMEWVKEKREEAQEQGKLNPFDATMVAQISPGELNGVNNALEYAHDLVIKWLPKYKFKGWNKTETRKKAVSLKMKRDRAKEIAQSLTDHSKWRSHGRSLKIKDLKGIGLKVDLVEANPEICEIVDRIQVVIRLLFVSTNTYKVFAIEGSKIFATAAIGGPTTPQPVQQLSQVDTANLNLTCPQCGTLHKLYAKLADNPEIDKKMTKTGFTKFPSDAKLVCSCGYELDLTGAKNEIEANSGRKVVE